jgi:hypothetical protein
MKKTAITLSLGAGLGILLTTGAASAAKLKDVTCNEFLAMDAAQQNRVAYWMSGIAAGSSSKEVDAGEIDVGYDAAGEPVAAVIADCEGDKTASLWQKIKKHF